MPSDPTKTWAGRLRGAETKRRPNERGRQEQDMTKSELIQKIAQRYPQLYHRDVERIVSTIFDEISAALVAGNRVELRGFGAFSVRHRNARTGRNPRTGDAVEVDEKAIPFFKSGKLLRERLNRGLPQEGAE